MYGKSVNHRLEKGLVERVQIEPVGVRRVGGRGNSSGKNPRGHLVANGATNGRNLKHEHLILRNSELRHGVQALEGKHATSRIQICPQNGVGLTPSEWILLDRVTSFSIIHPVGTSSEPERAHHLPTQICQKEQGKQSNHYSCGGGTEH
jgi:hypothetical protein